MRPEWKRGALGSLNRPRVRAGHRSQPELELGLGTGHERDVATIRRHRKLCDCARTPAAGPPKDVFSGGDGELDRV